MTGFLILGSLVDTRSSNLQLNLCSIMALSFKPRIFSTILDFISTPPKNSYLSIFNQDNTALLDNSTG